MKKYQVIVLMIFSFILFQNCGKEAGTTRTLSLSNDTILDDQLGAGNNEPLILTENLPIETTINLPPPTTQFQFLASDAQISGGLMLMDGALLNPVSQLDPTLSGTAQFTFIVEKAGEYVIDAEVIAPTQGSNSFFLEIDAAPDETMAWYMTPTEVKQIVRVSRGGFSSGNNAEHRFILDEGTHILFIGGREANTLLFSLSISLVEN